MLETRHVIVRDRPMPATDRAGKQRDFTIYLDVEAHPGAAQPWTADVDYAARFESAEAAQTFAQRMGLDEPWHTDTVKVRAITIPI